MFTHILTRKRVEEEQTQFTMEGLPVGWTVHSYDHGGGEGEGGKGGLLKDGKSPKLHVYELFHEDAQGFLVSSQPWWRVKLFVWEPVLFGTWDGVFTSCMINIFGVVLFLRTGYLVGNTGVLLGMFLVSLVVVVALVTVFSGVGISEHCGVGGGGIYSMISCVLGGRVGGTVGLLYVFGQCVAGAMYITGFSESAAVLLGLQQQWAVRTVSAVVLLALLGINLAGVKWIVRLQLLLLAVLAVSTLDFVIGTFTHLDPEHGFVGYTEELLQSNSMPDYSPGESFFTVFGVFFPAATGVMAGFNMSSDLQRPEHNIPVGTLAAVFTSWFLYLVFVFLLGAICTRETLRYDFLIAEKVSLVGFLFLLGLYISSLASCMGGLYGAPRILQCIAQERVIPGLSFLGQGKGPNKTPVAAICLTGLLTMAFVLIGQVNILAPIVTINFMLTYSFIDYSFFCVAITYQLQTKDKKKTHFLAKQKECRTAPSICRPLIENNLPNYGSGDLSPQKKGTLLEFTNDMNQIFPNDGESMKDLSTKEQKCNSKRKVDVKQMLMNSFDLKSEQSKYVDGQEEGKTSNLTCADTADRGSVLTKDKELHPPVEQNINTVLDDEVSKDHGSIEIKPITNSFYQKVCNHWIALIGAFGSIMIMFVIEWIYALANISVALLLFFYIGKTNPGLPLGIAARFSFFKWLKTTLKNIGRENSLPQDEIVLTPSLPGVGLKTKQLTEENADFASRLKYHQSSFIGPDNMVQPTLSEVNSLK
ncbi:solute carrier family 12 member 8 [Periophthalmus magnuspinnatus]|uniref:solute carrier family 12 member 8 n=1 Tax=Periophthalmus magnuspinnatus TaxID=409849 RepID=UPI002436341B|nr:solute carrier family 12 member 8 [Periophthalmus magnuspinnatus]